MGWHETWVDYFRFPYLAIWWQSRNYFVWWIAFSLSMSESVNDLHLDMFNQSFWGISHVGPTNDAITMMSAKWRVLSLYSTIMNEIMRQNVCQHLRRGGFSGGKAQHWTNGLEVRQSSVVGLGQDIGIANCVWDILKRVPLLVIHCCGWIMVTVLEGHSTASLALFKL